MILWDFLRKEMAAFMERRARGGVGLIVTGKNLRESARIYDFFAILPSIFARVCHLSCPADVQVQILFDLESINGALTSEHSDSVVRRWNCAKSEWSCLSFRIQAHILVGGPPAPHSDRCCPSARYQDLHANIGV
jgi:hypothetical protein